MDAMLAVERTRLTLLFVVVITVGVICAVMAGSTPGTDPTTTNQFTPGTTQPIEP